MPKEDKLVPANQTILNKKIIDFLIYRQRKDEKFLGPVTDLNYKLIKDNFDQVIVGLNKSNGKCAGYSAMKARGLHISRYQKDAKNHLPIHNNDWFKRTRQLLAKWSPDIDKEYTDEQRNDIFLFSEQAIFSQDHSSFLYSPSSIENYDLDVILPVLVDKTKLPEFKRVGQIFGFYSAVDLATILNSILKKDRFIFLSSFRHVGLLFINDENKIEFFDSNHDDDDVIYENVNSVVHYFSTEFPYLRADALLPVCLYAYTMSAFDNDFPSVHEVAQLCESGEIAYSPNIPGYLGGISSVTLTTRESEPGIYRTYFAEQIASKTSPQVAWMVVLANWGYGLDGLKNEFIDLDLNESDPLGQTMLMHTVIAEKYFILKELLKENIRLNLQDIYGWTALMYASQHDNQEIFTELLLAGCDPLIKDKTGKSVVTHLIQKKNLKILKNFVNFEFKDGNNILMKAILENDIQVVSELLPFTDINNKQSQAALRYAAKKDNAEIFEKLLMAGADPFIGDEKGESVITYLCQKNNSAALKILLSHQFLNGNNILLEAIIKQDVKSVGELVHVVDVNCKDQLGQTALIYAVQHGEVEIFKILLLAGADISMQDKSGKTAREYAEDENQQSVVLLIDTWLAKKTVKVSPPEDSKSLDRGKTPLMIASAKNDISEIKKLLDSKMDVNMKDEKGRTALFYAAAAGHEQAANELLTAGADPLIEDKLSKTARHYACINKKLDLMFRIMEAEIDAELPKPASPSSSPRDKNRHFGIFNETTSRSQSITTESNRQAPAT